MKDLFSRKYRELKAVNNISFSIEEGEMVGYIGPNGAGKSTTIKMLTGILRPSAGDIKVIGYHPFLQRREYTRHIGVVFGQRTQLWWDIAVIESFKLLARIYDIDDKTFRSRLDELNDVLEMSEFLHTPVRKLSLGQRIRSDLAASLIHSPPVLFLDEPTIGLDAVAKESVRKFLRHINATKKTTIILTTHDLDEIEELCERILIIDTGAILFDGPLDRIREIPGLTKKVLVDFTASVQGGDVSTILPGVTGVLENPRRAELSFDPKQVSTVDLIREVVGKFPVADLSILEPNIEDIVMKIYREGIEPGRG